MLFLKAGVCMAKIIFLSTLTIWWGVLVLSRNLTGFGLFDHVLIDAEQILRLGGALSGVAWATLEVFSSRKEAECIEKSRGLL